MLKPLLICTISVLILLLAILSIGLCSCHLRESKNISTKDSKGQLMNFVVLNKDCKVSILSDGKQVKVCWYKDDEVK